ncbi:hypothetical protein BT96DRAFT_1008610 [Gymnopus androsaceus JB14]|uniref:Uncharacterized protein n=1 Tax=Gymnopus androsaceus JB14 TaxID=1447944 RepID=A0A6A4GEH7_9AGAR|nr:hypothetical protein BT96DRAFT_1008610 [Gymnopus androsaceus JB14]
MEGSNLTAPILPATRPDQKSCAGASSLLLNFVISRFRGHCYAGNTPTTTYLVLWNRICLPSNPLLFPILHAPAESVGDLSDASGLVSDALADAAEKGSEGLWAGSSLAIVAGFQTLVGGGTGHGTDAGSGLEQQAPGLPGLAAGGAFEAGDDAPRAISERWFEIVCPYEQRRFINTRKVKPAIWNAPGIDVLNHWAKVLREALESCIEIQGDYDQDMFAQVFNLWIWGSSRVLSLWEFTSSPVSRLFVTSPIVKSALGPKDPFDRMMAVHIRREDFEEACQRLAYYNSSFYSWNLLPRLPDSFDVPPSIVWDSPEYKDLYAKHTIRPLPRPFRLPFHSSGSGLRIPRTISISDSVDVYASVPWCYLGFGTWNTERSSTNEDTLALLVSIFRQ